MYKHIVGGREFHNTFQVTFSGPIHLYGENGENHFLKMYLRLKAEIYSE